MRIARHTQGMHLHDQDAARTAPSVIDHYLVSGRYTVGQSPVWDYNLVVGSLITSCMSFERRGPRSESLQEYSSCIPGLQGRLERQVQVTETCISALAEAVRIISHLQPCRGMYLERPGEATR